MSRQMKKIEEDGVGRKKERATSSQMVTTRSSKKKDTQKVHGPLMLPRITVSAENRAMAEAADGAVKKKRSSQMTNKSAKKEEVARNLKRSLPAPTR